MPCDPNELNMTAPIGPPFDLPGFGSLFSPLQIGLPQFELPTDLLEDLLLWLNKLKLPFPGFDKLQPNLDFATKAILDAIAKVLNMLAPFLALYNFIMALLKMLMCIIEVLCAIPDPFAIANKMIKLFTECLPPFLNLFPWLALIAMILAILLLILMLIEYIIMMILAIIAAIIRNIMIFVDAARLHDAQSILTAVQKIASLTCLIQNIMAILAAIAALIAVIEALMKIGGGSICDDSDPDGCCYVCPPFIKNTPNGIPTTKGKLVYYSQIGVDMTAIPGFPPELAAMFNIPPARYERWQLVDKDASPEYAINLIATPFLPPLIMNTFWPDPLSFQSDLAKNKAPYTANLRLKVRPSDIGLDGYDGYTERYFRINDCIVVRRPYAGVLNSANVPDFTYANGTLNIEGGKVYEDDGVTQYKVDGYHATLNTFIHKASSTSTTLPATDDSYTFDDVEFTWFPNAAALAGYQLITMGCMPQINLEKKVLNSIIAAEGTEPVELKLKPAPDGKRVKSTGIMPNIVGAVECVQVTLDKFKKDVNAETAAELQASVEICLGDLRDQVLSTICDAIITGTSQFKSKVEIDSDAQFTTRTINAAVTLKDGAGNTISANIPSQCVPSIEALLQGEVTLGTIDKFEYDGYEIFNAAISSDRAGDGELRMVFNGKVFSTVTQGSLDAVTSIAETVLKYTFVDATFEPPVRRNEGDV